MGGIVRFGDRLRRLQRLAEGETVVIPQPDGPPMRFPESALKEAFLTTARRQMGEDVPPHPLALAATRSPSPEWNRSFYANDVDEPEGVEDLSE